MSEEYQCGTCPRSFQSWRACQQHMRDTNHLYHVCRICAMTWPTEEDRISHEANMHHHCAKCNRLFQNYNNVKMHLNSRAHRGQPMDCPFCRRCFVTATGLATHLESGRCRNAPFLSRDAVYGIVRIKDPQGFISKRLLGWRGSSRYAASSASWNGDAFECVLCHREFNSLYGLNQHLNSPVHQQSLYHCPNRACGMDFKTLAGVVNHLESESCGFARFAAVQRKMDDILSSDRMLTF